MNNEPETGQKPERKPSKLILAISLAVVLAAAITVLYVSRQRPANATDYIIPAIRLTGTELLQKKMILIVKVERNYKGDAVVSFRRRPWGSGGKPGRVLSDTVRVLFSKDRIILEPASALMNHNKNLNRNYRLTEVACLALSSLPHGYPGDEFEMDIYQGEPREYLVSIIPYTDKSTVIIGSDITVPIIDNDGKLSVGEIMRGY